MIQQIFQITTELFVLVSITSSQTTVQLKSMGMQELQQDLVSTLKGHQLESQVESIYDDELILTITRNPVIKTVVKLERTRHRPLDIIINVDYSKVGSTKDVLRMTKPQSSNDDYDFRWLWIPLVFGGLIIAILQMFGDAIASLLGSETGLTTTQQIVTVVVLSILFAVGWIYGVPALLRKKNQKMKDFDQEVMELLTQRIAQLDFQQTATETKRCWSCFEQISIDTMTCPACSETQK